MVGKNIYKLYKKAILPFYTAVRKDFYSTEVIDRKFLFDLKQGNFKDSSNGLTSSYSNFILSFESGLAAKGGLFHEDRLQVIKDLKRQGYLADTFGCLFGSDIKSKYYFNIPDEVISLVVSESVRLKRLSVITLDDYLETLKKIWGCLEYCLNYGGKNIVVRSHDIDGLLVTSNGYLYLLELKASEKNQDHHIWGDFSKALETWACILYYYMCLRKDKSLIYTLYSELNEFCICNLRDMSWNSVSLLYIVHSYINIDSTKGACAIYFDNSKESIGGVISAEDFYKFYFGIDFNELVKIEQKLAMGLNKDHSRALAYIKSECKKYGIY